ncbi:hypothetical protein BESB_048130 [Besnoitia besnoiti]|uniref:Uncharacterized protein n=1 Tax=Besnoitia besnoiti TaxID=94643 RepID=A0A2A9MK32_BESBE|nr:hypothetical protein BESB_048130 [Besnoitia besnoiti]PFH36621.1 hypothetical protein BESB_048130 [Besnoitia besnoiti]
MAFFDDSSSFFSSSFGGGFGGPVAGDSEAHRRASGGSGFGSQPFEDFTSPSLFPSQQQAESKNRASAATAGFQGTSASGAEGLVYVTVGMLQRAARDMQEGAAAQGEGHLPSDGEKKEDGSKHAFRLHGNDVGLVGLRGWVAPPGCEKLASLVRFKLADGTGEIEVEYDVVDGKPWWEVHEEEAAGVVIPELEAAGAAASGGDAERTEEAKKIQVLSGKKRFLQVGSLVRIAAGVSTDLNGEVSLSASSCAPIKDASEFVFLHPAAVAHAAATFAARRGTLRAEEDVGRADAKQGDLAGVKKAKTGDGEAVKGEPNADGEDGASSLASSSLLPEEEQKLLQDYDHVEDALQRDVVLILLTLGGGAKRAPKDKVKAEARRRRPSRTEEEVDAALKGLEEAAEIVEHAGYVALAC